MDYQKKKNQVGNNQEGKFACGRFDHLEHLMNMSMVIRALFCPILLGLQRLIHVLNRIQGTNSSKRGMEQVKDKSLQVEREEI